MRKLLLQLYSLSVSCTVNLNLETTVNCSRDMFNVFGPLNRAALFPS